MQNGLLQLEELPLAGQNVLTGNMKTHTVDTSGKWFTKAPSLLKPKRLKHIPLC